MLLYRSVFYGISCFFVQNFPLSFWTSAVFGQFNGGQDGPRRSVAKFKVGPILFGTNLSQNETPKVGSELWKIQNFGISESEVSVFFWFLQVVSTTTWSSKRKVGSSLKMIGHLLLSQKPQQIPPSLHDTRSAWRRKETDSASVATPPAEGLASAAAAFRDLRGNKDHNRCRWRIVQLMKEIRGSRRMSYLFGSSTALEILQAMVWDVCSVLLPVSDVSMDCKNSTKDTKV